MTFKDTITKLEHLHSLFAGGGDDSVFTPAQKGWISTLHKAEYGTPVRECGCKNKYTDAVVTLLLSLRKRGQLHEEAHYRLRRGVLIWLNNECYSIHNLTDKVAKEWLELHPDETDKFEKIDNK